MKFLWSSSGLRDGLWKRLDGVLGLFGLCLDLFGCWYFSGWYFWSCFLNHGLCDSDSFLLFLLHDCIFL